MTKFKPGDRVVLTKRWPAQWPIPKGSAGTVTATPNGMTTMTRVIFDRQDIELPWSGPWRSVSTNTLKLISHEKDMDLLTVQQKRELNERA